MQVAVCVRAAVGSDVIATVAVTFRPFGFTLGEIAARCGKSCCIDVTSTVRLWLPELIETQMCVLVGKDVQT